MQSILKPADEKADEALAGIEQGAKGGADESEPTIGEKASQATDKAKDSTGSAWESAKQGTADSTQKTKDSTGKAWESTKQGTSDAAEATKEKAGQAKDESANLLQKVKNKNKNISIYIPIILPFFIL